MKQLSLLLLIISITILSCQEKKKHVIISGTDGPMSSCDSVEVNHNNQSFDKDENGNYYYDLTITNRSKYELKRLNLSFVIYHSSSSELPFSSFIIHFDETIMPGSQIQKKIYAASNDAPFAFNSEYKVEDFPINELYETNLDSAKLFFTGLHCWHEYE
jgi:hypothetical protein